MKKSLYKEIWRTIRHSRGRFWAILGIVALGAGFFAGFRATAPDMRSIAESYYDQSRMFDIHLLSNVGFNESDVKALLSTQGVEGVMPIHSVDIAVQTKEQELLLRVYGLPADTGEDNPDYLNRPVLLSGRWPQNPGECLVGVTKVYLKDAMNKIRIGDTLKIIETNSGLEDAFNYDNLKVVGFVKSAYYISFSIGSTTMGNGMLDNFIYVSDSDFTGKTYTDIFATVSGAQELQSFDKDYGDHLRPVKNSLEAIGPAHSSARFAEAKAELADARAKYDENKAEAEKELTDAQKKLDDSLKEIKDNQKKLADGEQEYRDGVRELAAQKEDFNKQVAEAQKELEDGGKKAADGRIKLADAQNELNEKKKELEEKKADAEKKFADAEAKLDDAKAELDEGREALDEAKKELAAGKSKYSRKRQEASQQFAALAAQLEAAEAEITANETTLEAAQAQYDTGMEALALFQQQLDALEANIEALEAAIAALPAGDPALPAMNQQLTDLQTAYDSNLAAYQNQEAALAAAKSSLDAGRDQLAAAKAELAASQAEYQSQSAAAEIAFAEAKQKINAAAETLAEKEEQWEEGKNEYDEGLAELNSQKEDYYLQITDAQKKIDDAQDEINAKEAELAQAEEDIKQGWQDLAQNKKDALQEFADAERELADAKNEIRDGYQELTQGKLDWADGKKEYLEQKADADRKLAEAAAKLAKGQSDLNSVKEPKWYVLDRSANLGYASFAADAERMASLSTVFPIIFFLVAALVSLTTMTRMVEEERTLIGTYKALGYDNGKIALKYLFYAALASVTGSIIGILIGFQVLPRLIWNSYTIMYFGPEFHPAFHWQYALTSFSISVFCTCSATFLACREALKEAPANLMLPRAPKAGKRIFLERIDFLWSRFSFIQKVTARNLFRYKKRLLMTVIGIAGCTGLLLSGFGVRDSVTGIMSNQFDHIYRYNTLVDLGEGRLSDQARGILEDKSLFSYYMRYTRKNLDVTGPDGVLNAYLFVPQETSRLKDFITLRDRNSGEDVAFNSDSVVLSEKMAKKIGAEAGDVVRINNSHDEPVSLTVTGITENYINNYIYIAPELYQSKTGDKLTYSQLLAQTAPEADRQKEIADRLLAQPDIITVSYTNDVRNSFSDMMESLDYVVLVLIFSAGMLAFIVLYNLTNINVTERQRELATIKVLGFYDSEVSSYIYREINVLTAIGCACGLVLGVFMHALIIKTAEVDMVMFGRQIKAWSFIWSALMTFAFSLIVNLFMHFKLKKIDMVESLKSVD